MACDSHFPLRFSFSLFDAAKDPQNKRREPSPKKELSFRQPPLLLGPKRNLAAGCLDPLWARRRPGRFSIRGAFPFCRCSSVSVYSIFDLLCPLAPPGRVPQRAISLFLFYLLFAWCFPAFVHFQPLFDYVIAGLLCLGYPFFEHEICIDFSSIWGRILVLLLMVCLKPFSVRVRSLLSL